MADEVLSDLLLLDPDLCESVMEEGMKHWVAYSCWTQISASPCGGGVLLDVKVEPPENEYLSLRGEMSPEDSVTRWMDMVCRLQLYDIFYL